MRDKRRVRELLRIRIYLRKLLVYASIYQFTGRENAEFLSKGESLLLFLLANLLCCTPTKNFSHRRFFPDQTFFFICVVI